MMSAAFVFMFKNYLLILLLFVGGQLFAQREAANWVFGGFGGINFLCPSNGIITTPFDGLEGGACISSSNGELLFITNGDVVWNRDFRIMPNGRGIGGLCEFYGNYASASQSGLIIPHPGNPNRCYHQRLSGVRCLRTQCNHR